MAEENGKENETQNKTVVYLLGVIVVLLLVIVGVIVWPSISGDVPEPTVTAEDAAQTTAQDSGAQPAGVAPEQTEFDPTNATTVPEGQTPEEFVAEYYEAILAEDWETVYAMLPAEQKAGTDAQAYGEQVTSYGVTGYEIVEAADTEEGFVVTADQVTGGFGTFVNAWVFVDADGVWTLKGKSVTGMK